MRIRTSDLRIPRFDALPLSHRDSTVSEVFYEVHTAGSSNVDSVMFVKEIKKDVFIVLSRSWEFFRSCLV